MELALAWIAFPLLLAAASGGLGLLVERLAGARVPGALVVPLGFAALVAVATLSTAWSVTAPATPYLAAALALAGVAAGWGRLRDAPPDPALALLALGVLAVYAAPVALSGEPTFAGYGVLGDTAVQLIGVDRLLDAGRTLDGLAPSSYQGALDAYFGSGYPFGAQVAIGSLRPFVGVDLAWVYQPGLAFIVVCLALSLHVLATQVVRGRWTAAAVAFVAAQPALVFAYALQGSVKELAAAALLALLAALLVPFARAVRDGGASARVGVPLAVAVAAAGAVLGPAVALWAGPLAVAALVLAVRAQPGGGAPIRQVAAFAGVVLVLSVPLLVELGGYFRVTAGVVTANEEVGNLLRALDPLQAMGIWINGDYRLLPDGRWLPVTRVLIALALAGALLGVVVAVRRRAWPTLLYAGTALVGAVVVVGAGSPWADAKALMIISPALLLVALLGPTALATADGGRGWAVRSSTLALGLAIVAGVLASNALAYRDARLAPYDRLAELQDVGERLDGRGPVLTTEFEEFGKHFLRAADPSGVSEAYSPRPADPAPDGGDGPRFGHPSDLDALSQAYVHAYPTLVLRRSPLASRPPADYELTWRGDWYDVWTRRADGAEVLAHLPLGSQLSPSARPTCADVATLARQARAAGAQLAFSERAAPAAFVPAQAGALPGGWSRDRDEPLFLRSSGGGSLAGTASVAAAGDHVAWVGGSFGTAPLALEIDGRRVGTLRRALSGRGQYARVGRPVALAAGEHEVRLVRLRRPLSPGNGGSMIGPVVLEPAAPAPAVRYAPPSAWRTLCDRTLDWIEVVRR
jgi:hypothetical protein